MTIRAVSYGGGVQSNALLILAARGDIDFRTFLFSNVGDDSEHPDTLDYVRNVAVPYARDHGIDLRELHKVRRDGTPETLMDLITRDSRSIPIPMFLASGAPGNRTCTAQFKIKVISRELKRLGATVDDPAVLALGISVDEFHRARTDSGIPHQRLAYPLIDLRLSRQDCLKIIADEGLPTPPKSSCFFCPFHTDRSWRQLLKTRPDLFAQAVAMERMLNERRRSLGRDDMYLNDSLKPLDQAIVEDGQLDMFQDQDDTGGCSNAGYCFI